MRAANVNCSAKNKMLFSCNDKQQLRWRRRDLDCDDRDSVTVYLINNQSNESSAMA